MVKIVLMSGSTRQDSVNGAVLETVRHVLAGLPGEHESVSLAVADLPFYEAGLERSGASDAVRAAQELVAGADALFISTPSYNGDMPGALKNALDWLSRGIGGPSALTGKVTAVASASPGRAAPSTPRPGWSAYSPGAVRGSWSTSRSPSPGRAGRPPRTAGTPTRSSWRWWRA